MDAVVGLDLALTNNRKAYNHHGVLHQPMPPSTPFLTARSRLSYVQRTDQRKQVISIGRLDHELCNLRQTYSFSLIG